MKDVWHELWGGGSGRATRLVPRTRILCGAMLFATAIAVPVDHVAGVLFLVMVVVAWIAACRPPGRVLRAFFVLGLTLFLPYFLLVPLIRIEYDSQGWNAALLAAWRVAARGQAGLLITTATLSTLSLSDLRQGLLALPIPRLVCLIVFQVLHQTAELYYETRRIAAAISVRGAAGYVRTGWRLIVSLPTVWLPRVINRAERVGGAMEVRQYDCDAVAEANRLPLSLTDAGTLILALSAFLAALAWRGGVL